MEKGQFHNDSSPSAPPPQPPPSYEDYFDTVGAVASPPEPYNMLDPVPPIGFIEPHPPTGGGAMPMPPADMEPPPPPYSECALNVDCLHSEEEVRTAILNHYKDDCCFHPESIDTLSIHEITPMHAFRYVLNTFTETRTLQEKTEPYKNQPIDGAQNGPTPDKWSVPAYPPQEFIVKAKFVMDLPRSTSVQPCNKCHSTGFTACTSCNGMGFSRCTWCSGSGRRPKAGHAGEFESCSSCCGMGRNNCSWCQLGRTQCRICQGHRFLKTWQSLTIRWKTEQKIFETERDELKPKHLKKAKCGEVLSSTKTTPQNPQPLKCSLDPNIFQVAQKFVGEQLQKQNMDCRVLKFDQMIGVIPVVKVIYKYKNKDGHFFIYGNTRLVYFPRGYPGGSGCCCSRCCCSIM